MRFYPALCRAGIEGPVLVIDINTIQKQDMEVDIHILFTVNKFLCSGIGQINGLLRLNFLTDPAN